MLGQYAAPSAHTKNRLRLRACLLRAQNAALHTVAFFETVYTAAGIDELLLAGIERMALGADFNPQFLFNRTGGERLSTGAPYLALTILRVNILLQCFHLFSVK